MRPILEVLADGNEQAVGNVYESVAERLGLSKDDLSEMLPSGKQRTFANRVGWAKTYLSKAGLVATPRRGVVHISEPGREALLSGKAINNAYLRQFEAFRQFHARTTTEKPPEGGDMSPRSRDESTPDESLEQLYRSMRQGLALELLEHVQAASPAFFEQLVVQLLVAMGYGGSVKDAGKAIGRSGDNGIDGIIKQDRLGLDNVYIQAKRYAAGRSVGSGEVRDLAGALQMHKATRGVLITTSTFSADAVRTARAIGNIVLIEGEELAELMAEHGVGVTTTAVYELKRIDQDFFEQ